MKNIKQTIQHIFKVENQLKASENKLESEIDINDDNWLNIAKSDSEKFIETHISDLKVIEEKLFECFLQGEKSDIDKLIDAIEKTQLLKNYIGLNIKDLENSTSSKRETIFKKAVIIKIFVNLEPDPRDNILYLQELISEAKKYRINYKKLILELIPFASEKAKYETNSMKFILESIIN